MNGGHSQATVRSGSDSTRDLTPGGICLGNGCEACSLTLPIQYGVNSCRGDYRDNPSPGYRSAVVSHSHYIRHTLSSGGNPPYRPLPWQSARPASRLPRQARPAPALRGTAGPLLPSSSHKGGSGAGRKISKSIAHPLLCSTGCKL
jgi:hypothetical protein